MLGLPISGLINVLCRVDLPRKVEIGIGILG